MEAVRFAPRRLGHVNLYVSNLARSIEFYEQVCGLRKVRSESAIRAGFLSNGNTHHDLGLIEISRGDTRLGRDGKVQISSTRGTRPGLNHLGWEMENEAQLIAAYRRLIAAGLKPTALFDHLVSHAVYVADPDGNVHEFYADMMNDWQRVFNLDTDDLVTSQWDPLAEDRPCEQSFYIDPARTSAHPGGMLPSEYVTGAWFTTRRFDAMTHFMTEVAGLHPIETVVQAASRETIFGGSQGRPEVRLTEVAEGQPVGFRSFALKVEHGAAQAGRFARLPAEALRAKVEATDRIACVLRDPDGCEVEVYEPRGAAVLAPSSRADH